jgi:hypothetical protein
MQTGVADKERLTQTLAQQVISLEQALVELWAQGPTTIGPVGRTDSVWDMSNDRIKILNYATTLLTGNKPDSAQASAAESAARRLGSDHALTRHLVRVKKWHAAQLNN